MNLRNARCNDKNTCHVNFLAQVKVHLQLHAENISINIQLCAITLGGGHSKSGGRRKIAHAHTPAHMRTHTHTCARARTHTPAHVRAHTHACMHARTYTLQIKYRSTYIQLLLLQCIHLFFLIPLSPSFTWNISLRQHCMCLPQ